MIPLPCCSYLVALTKAVRERFRASLLYNAVFNISPILIQTSKNIGENGERTMLTSWVLFMYIPGRELLEFGGTVLLALRVFHKHRNHGHISTLLWGLNVKAAFTYHTKLCLLYPV